MILRTDALKVACPACGAAANALCTGPKGTERWALHADRRTAASKPAPVKAPAKRRGEPTDAEILDWLQQRAYIETRDGGWSSFYYIAIPKMAIGPWQRRHGGGEFDHKTLREAVAALLKAKP